jgi:hypothetical protein
MVGRVRELAKRAAGMSEHPSGQQLSRLAGDPRRRECERRALTGLKVEAIYRLEA